MPGPSARKPPAISHPCCPAPSGRPAPGKNWAAPWRSPSRWAAPPASGFSRTCPSHRCPAWLQCPMRHRPRPRMPPPAPAARSPPARYATARPRALGPPFLSPSFLLRRRLNRNDQYRGGRRRSRIGGCAVHPALGARLNLGVIARRMLAPQPEGSRRPRHRRWCNAHATADKAQRREVPATQPCHQRAKSIIRHQQTHPRSDDKRRCHAGSLCPHIRLFGTLRGWV